MDGLTEFDSAPSDITASKFGGFAERRVPIGHPSSNGKSNVMASAFTNKLSESSYGGTNRLTTANLQSTAMSRDTHHSRASSHNRDQFRQFGNMQSKQSTLSRQPRERSENRHARQQLVSNNLVIPGMALVPVIEKQRRKREADSTPHLLDKRSSRNNGQPQQ